MYKRYMYKTVAFFLVLTLLAGLVSFTPKNVKAADSGYYQWSDYATYLKGAGTEANPFLISTPNDLAYFRKQVATVSGTISYYSGNDTSTAVKTKDADASFYKLTNDIYYNDPNGTEWESWSDTVKPTNGGSSAHTWAPPGYGDESTRRFEGHFDGNGYTIYGLYIVHAEKNCVGFIGSMRYGSIENLTLAKGYVSGANLVGGFLGQAKVGADIVNCTSYLKIKGANGVGGFIGGNPVNGSSLSVEVDITSEATVPNFAVYNCVNKSKVTATSYAGGVVGYIVSGTCRAQMVRCENSGTITVSTNCAGGIIGGTKYLNDRAHNYVEYCVNTGTIKGGNGSYAGGIVGCGRATEIYSCVNHGAVSSTANYTGGISGGNNTSDGLANGKIFYCFNDGSVTGASYTGGIVGVSKSVNVNQCGNVGNVSGTTYVGGISGKGGGSSDGRDTEIYDCYNTGKVVSTNNSTSVAGIVGEAYCEGTVSDNKYVKVRRCINLGSVTGGRGIANSTSTLMAEDGSDLFVYSFASSCFALQGVNTTFKGGTAVSSMALPTVLAELSAAGKGVWSAGYPYPTLDKIDYALQGRASSFGALSVKAIDAPALEISFSINTNDAYYKSISSFDLGYGVIAVNCDGKADVTVTEKTEGAILCSGTLSGSTVTAKLSDINEEQFDDNLTLRPYISFTVEGQKVFVYGTSAQTTFYNATGADTVQSISGTANLDCDTELYLLTGTTAKINNSLYSSGNVESTSFVSSNPEIATVKAGKVTGIKAGTTDISVTYTGAWGAKTTVCTVTVLDDLSSTVNANQYADKDAKLRLHTNELVQVHTSVTKNDGFVLDRNGTVAMIDGGNNNDASTKYLLSLREEFLKEGLESGMLSKSEYHRLLLSKKCKLDVISLITHWHSDHIYSLRYFVSATPFIRITNMYTTTNPAGTDAEGHSSYLSSFDKMLTEVKKNSPDINVVRSAYEKSTVIYLGDGGTISSTATDLKLTMLTSKDWSNVTALKTNSTAWVNSSSSWYVFEYGGNKLLFTGDTYPNDTGSTYTGASTSGKTAVDYMLSKHKAIVDSGVTFLDCNHHSRSSYVENLFTVTKPSMVFAGVYYGQENVTFTDKAVETADFYLGGDAGHVFVFAADGSIDTSGAVVAYPQNDNGRAIRNHLPIHYDLEEKAETVKEAPLTAPTSLSLSAEKLWVAADGTATLTAIVGGGANSDKNVEWTVSDTSVLTTDGATLKVKKTGTVTLTAKAGSLVKSCVVTVVLKGDTNNDGIVSTADCINLRMAMVNSTENNGLIVASADFSSDGIITAADYSSMKLFIKQKG